MRFTIVLLLILILSNSNLHAQFSGEYIYNPQLAMSADGQIIAVSGRAFSDSTARLGGRYPIDFYDTATGNRTLEYNGSDFPISAMALNSNGDALAYTTNGGQLAIVDVTTGNDEAILVEGGSMEVDDPSWNITDEFFAASSGRVIAVYDAASFQNYVPIIHDGDFSSTVLGYAWHLNSPKVAVSMRDPNSGASSILIWSITSEQTVTLDQTIATSSGSQLAWHPNGQLVATNQRGGVKTIDVASAVETTLHSPNPDDAIRAIAWNFDGSELAAGGSQAVYVWDVQSESIIKTIPTEDTVRDIFWSPDGQYIYHTGGTAGVYRDGLPLQEAILRSGNQQ